MENKNGAKKRKAKDAFFQVSESFFEKEEILDIMSHYGYQGIGIYLKICIMLLKNHGKIKYDWKYISTKKSEKKIIEEIITRSGLFTLSNDKTYFTSDIVDEQLTERGKIRMDQTKRIQKRWEKEKTNASGEERNEGNNSRHRVLSTDEVEEMDRIDGIEPKKVRYKKWDDDDELKLDVSEIS